MALRSDTVSLGRGLGHGQTSLDRVVFEYPDWVDVIALTADYKIVLVEQFRHPVRQLRTEFPAGAVEDGETPLGAIQRELREETGFVARHWRLLGSVPVNPAWQDNRIHSFLALDARRETAQALDEGEMIGVRELAFDRFVADVESGDIELPALQLGGLLLLAIHVKRAADGRLLALKERGVP